MPCRFAASLLGLGAFVVFGCSSSSESTDSSTSTGGAGNAAGGASGSGNAVGGASSSTSGGVSSVGSTTTGEAAVRWIGRVDASDPAAVKFAWSGTGFVANVEGSRISVKLQSVSSAAFYQPVVDGTPGVRFSVAAGSEQTVVLAEGLAAGSHQVELYRDTEGMYGYSVFTGFAEGTLLAPPAAPGRNIEVIGDSISAGYGNLGLEVHPPWDNTCTFSLDTEAAYQAYSLQLGRLLAADVSVIAHSGWGIYRDYGGSTSGVLSQVYDHTLGTQESPTWDFAVTPDVIVINLGTNDSATGDPGQPYEDAYVAFLQTIRSHAPDAWIFLTMGPMTADPLLTTMRTHIANVVVTAADSKIVSVDLAMQDLATTGCDYHPTVAEDTIMATTLQPVIAAKLGW